VIAAWVDGAREIRSRAVANVKFMEKRVEFVAMREFRVMDDFIGLPFGIMT
jgi:hypothetical protein